MRSSDRYSIAGFELLDIAAALDHDAGCRVTEGHGLVEFGGNLGQCGNQSFLTDLLENSLDMIRTLPRLAEQALSGQIDYEPLCAGGDGRNHRGNQDTT